MNSSTKTIRDFQKIKTLSDFNTLDAPTQISIKEPNSCPYDTENQLRVLITPKYGKVLIPDSLKWLENSIHELTEYDIKLTGIKYSWCYVTVRHGLPTYGDDSWHFDGTSFRIDTIPERNYLWSNHTPTQYRLGNLNFPSDFDPCKYNIHKYTDLNLDKTVYDCEAKKWYLFLPFCFHRRNPEIKNIPRTLIRITFLDVEIRDINNTPNPLLDTPAFGRNPVKDFRDSLIDYHSSSLG